MGIYNKNIRNNNGISYSKEVDGPSDWINIESETYFKDLSDSLIYYKNSNDIVISIFEEAGITSADNGLNISTSDDIELGGTLNKDTDINGNNKTLNLGTLTDALNGININSITSTRTHTFPGFDSITSEYTPGNLTINSVSLSGDQTHQNITTPFQYRREISDTSTNVTSYINLQDQLTFSSENTSTSQVSNLLFSTNQTSLSHSSGSGTSNMFTQTDSETSLYYSGNTQNGITITGDTINLYGPETNIDLNISGSIFTDNRVSGSTKGLEYGDDYHLGFTDRTLVDKSYVDDSIVNNITSSAGSGLTFNTTTNKIDLGGVLDRGTGDNNNRVFFTPMGGANTITYGLADDFMMPTTSSGANRYLDQLMSFTFNGYTNVIGFFGESSYSLGCFENQRQFDYLKQYKDITTTMNSDGSMANLPGATTGLRYQESDSASFFRRNIWEAGSNPNVNNESKLEQEYDKHVFEVSSPDVTDATVKRTSTFIVRRMDIGGSVLGLDGSTQGIFMLREDSVNLTTGDFYGITTIPNQTIVGKIDGSALWIATGSDDTKYVEASTNKKGIRYTGFSETNEDTGVDADYTTLVGTSLVPKKYVDDIISNNTLVDGSGTTYNLTTNSVDLGGILKDHTTILGNQKRISWGDWDGNDSSWFLPDPKPLSRFDVAAGGRILNLIVNTSGSDTGQISDRTSHNHVEKFGDTSGVDLSFNPTVGMTSYLHSNINNKFGQIKEVFETHGSNTRSYVKQTFDKFEWSVYNNIGGDNADDKTYLHIESERIIAGAAKSDGTKFGIFQFSHTHIQFLDGDFKGVGTFPTSTYLGNLGGSNLIIEDSTDSTFTDGTSNKRGLKYIGFGETDTETGVDADYTTLVGTSLVPKKYVDDAILDVNTIYSADDSLTDDRIVNLDNNSLTFDVGTLTSGTNNTLGLIIDGSNIYYGGGSISSPLLQVEGELGNILNVNSGGYLLCTSDYNDSIARFEKRGTNKGFGVGATKNTSGVQTVQHKPLLNSPSTKMFQQTVSNSLIDWQISFDTGTTGISNPNVQHWIRYGDAAAQVSFFRNGIGSSNFKVGGASLIGTEDISLQGDTLISKKLELSTTTDGILLPRLDTSQMNGILSPDTHLVIFNTTLNALYRYNGTAWVAMSAGYGLIEVKDPSGNPTFYSDLQAAIDITSSTDTVKIHSEIQLTSTVNIPGRTSLTIDFQGNRIYGDTSGGDFNLFTITQSNGNNRRDLQFIGGGVLETIGTVTSAGSAMPFSALNVGSDDLKLYAGETQIRSVNGDCFYTNGIDLIKGGIFYSENAGGSFGGTATVLEHASVDVYNRPTFGFIVRYCKLITRFAGFFVSQNSKIHNCFIKGSVTQTDNFGLLYIHRGTECYDNYLEQTDTSASGRDALYIRGSSPNTTGIDGRVSGNTCINRGVGAAGNLIYGSVHDNYFFSENGYGLYIGGNCKTVSNNKCFTNAVSGKQAIHSLAEETIKNYAENVNSSNSEPSLIISSASGQTHEAHGNTAIVANNTASNIKLFGPGALYVSNNIMGLLGTGFDLNGNINSQINTTDAHGNLKIG